MRRHVTFASLLALAAPLAAPLAAQTNPINGKRIDADIKVLSSDAYEGRGPATRAETKTIAYLEHQMKAAGLQPAGDPLPGGKRAWTQNVPLLRSEITGTPDLRLTLAGGETLALRQGEDIAVRAPLDGTGRIDLTDAPILFVGYGVTAPEKRWDDFKGQDVRGKLLVMLINDPDFETGQGDFGGKAMTYYGRWTYKYEEAARRGAAGVLIVHEREPASYGWATVRNSNTDATFDIVREQPRSAHTPMESWIERDLAVRLFKAAGLDFDAEKKKAQGRDFRPVPLNATLSAKVSADSQRIVSHNVAGRVVGTRYPDETLIYSAHWDHLGIGAPDAKGDRIYNGALDNASGTAALLEMGRAFAKGPRPARSVLFLSVTAEEKGLLGSEYYATHPLFPAAKTVGVLNMDGISLIGPARNFTISGSAKLGLLDDLVAEGKREGRVYTPEAHPEAGHFFRSDHFSFAKQGVPAISFDAGNDLVEGGTARAEQLNQEYIRDRYHQPADEWRADFDYRGAVQDLGLLYTLGEKLANSREWPGWSADSEFNAKRQATAVERK